MESERLRAPLWSKREVSLDYLSSSSTMQRNLPKYPYEQTETRWNHDLDTRDQQRSQ